MTRVLGLVAILAVFGASGAGSAKREPVLAVAGDTLLRVDPVTLKPSGTSRLGIADGAVVAARSPDGARLALAEGASQLAVVDLHGLRRIATVALPRAAGAAMIAWAGQQRVVVVRHKKDSRGGMTLTVVDPVEGRVVSHRWLAWRLLDARPTPTGVVVLVQRRTGMGMATLAVAGADGRVRSVGLQVIPAGRARIVRPGLRAIDRVEEPGLALDTAAGRAYVAGRDAIAAVDLVTLRVGVFTPPLRRPAKGGPAAGSTRAASWVGGGRLAVWGSDSNGETTIPTGLLVLNVHSGRLLRVDAPERAHFGVGGGLLLASGGISDRAPRAGDVLGVAAYGPAGGLRFRVLERERVYIAATVGSYAYLYRRLPSGRKLRSVLDLRTGAVVRTERHVWRMPQLLDG